MAAYAKVSGLLIWIVIFLVLSDAPMGLGRGLDAT